MQRAFWDAAGAVGPAGSYLVGLPEDRREVLRTAYLQRLGAPRGAFDLGAVARVAVGTVAPLSGGAV